MSEERPFAVTAQPEGLHHRKLLVILVTGILVVAVSLAVVTVWIGGRLHVATSIRGPAPQRISRVYQTLIGATHDAQDRKAAAERDLTSYHWVDRQRGLVRIPIERAFELMTGKEAK